MDLAPRIRSPWLKPFSAMQEYYCSFYILMTLLSLFFAVYMLLIDGAWAWLNKCVCGLLLVNKYYRSYVVTLTECGIARALGTIDHSSSNYRLKVKVER